MKASELIKVLLDRILEHGDDDVTISINGKDELIGNVEYIKPIKIMLI